MIEIDFEMRCLVLRAYHKYLMKVTKSETIYYPKIINGQSELLITPLNVNVIFTLLTGQGGPEGCKDTVLPFC